MDLPYATLDDLTARLDDLEGSDLVRKAISQAQKSHGDQKRDNGNPSLEEHIYPVTLDFIDYCQRHDIPVSAQTVAFALLHDVVEDDPDITEQYLIDIFDPGVGLHIARLTKPSYKHYRGRTVAEKKAAREEGYVRKLIERGSDEEVALKLIDRYNNLCCVHTSAPEKRDRYIEQTERLYLLLAAATGSLEMYRRIYQKLQELKSS